jgi:predicted O-methyltransferase YrrM
MKYPSHFTYPPNVRIWFEDHIQKWDMNLNNIINKPNICLEIGAYHGASSIYIREKLCNTPNSHLYIMDINKSEYLVNNIKPYDNITFIQGESRDSFKTFKHDDQTKEFLDFVYIDGSHMSIHVLEDAINAFYCLKNGGIMIFDDYLGGLEQEQYMQVKTGVDAFFYSFYKHLELLFDGYQIAFIKRTNFSKGDLTENYYDV